MVFEGSTADLTIVPHLYEKCCIPLIQQQTQILFQWLIEPFNTDLSIGEKREESQIKTLVFVLDGSLRNIPMAVLYDGNQYLIERYAIAVTPGLQLLDSTPLPLGDRSALLAGASNAPSFQRERLNKLPNVERELEQISQVLGNFEKLSNEQFMQTNIQNQINSAPFNIVHIATHGQFSSNPEKTFLLDWAKRIQVENLYNLLRVSGESGFNPIQLLVLSACETATGDERAALGLAGVAIRAGARSTLASLWQVNDASTAEFMIRFYRELNNPQNSKAEALRNVQLYFLSNEVKPDRDYDKPYYWTPFILVGNWL